MHGKFEVSVPELELLREMCAEVYDIHHFLELVAPGSELELDAGLKYVPPGQCGDAEYELDPRIPFTD